MNYWELVIFGDELADLLESKLGSYIAGDLGNTTIEHENVLFYDNSTLHRRFEIVFKSWVGHVKFTIDYSTDLKVLENYSIFGPLLFSGGAYGAFQNTNKIWNHRITQIIHLFPLRR